MAMNITTPETEDELAQWLALDEPGHFKPTSSHLSLARTIALNGMCTRALEKGIHNPKDLSFSCKFSSLFAKFLFGGVVEGNYHHQYNRIEGRVVDLNEHAADVKVLLNVEADVYVHDPDFFGNEEHLESVLSCIPRVKEWVKLFTAVELAQRNLAKKPPVP